MVKPITKCIKLLLLLAALLLLALVIWLHEGERSLAFAKPWITDAMNAPNAPYAVTFGDISIRWNDLTDFGQLRISKISVSKRDGNVFAQLPEMFVTIDPLGFLPDRRMFHTMALHSPRLLMSRNAAGAVQFGLEGSTSPMAMSELFTSITADAPTGKTQASALPFSEFTIDDATLTFSDAASGTSMISTPFAMRLTRHDGRYDAQLSMPFSFEEEAGRFDASLRTVRDSGDHMLNLKLTKVPSKMLCVFGLCPDNIDAKGRVEGDIGVRLAEDGTPLGVRANISTKRAILDAPKLFEKPVMLGNSTLVAESDGATKTITLTRMDLTLEDTTVSGQGTFRHAPDGWYVTLEGKAGTLDVAMLYKYWPLIMAPDSRLWVTSKIKSGRAENATLTLNLTPEDFAAVNYSDASVKATVDARDIRFEYLPGFPEVHGMNGTAHFTGTTVKVEGGGGTILSGTHISKATLWCPDLNNPRIPMESDVTLSATAADAANFLALSHFTFDDVAKLNPQTIAGTVDASMKLKFDSFSETKNADPNAINLSAVDYDIAATLKEVAQDALFGSYNARAVNGTLKADNNQMHFNASLALADSGVADIALSQPTGKPLAVTVKNQVAPGKASNDFALTYESSTEAPKIKLTGQRLDLSQSYGSSGDGSLLKDFPAMHLEVNLVELLMAQGMPFTKVVGALHCSAARCETASFKANVGKGQVKADIARNKGMRELLITASNAGQFLRAVDISDRVIDGKFQLRGDYNDSQNPAPLKARLLVEDFTLKNSQILGRILSVGSLTGLMNVLTGEGIAFDKMAADIVARSGVFHVSKGKASGNAMGMTLEGSIDSNTTKLKLKGVVVPAYAINSLLGNIPILGALAGGEGEGLIAFNYSIDGNFEKPDVSVNPLSGLTPGFLRGIFGVFDVDSDDDTQESADVPKTTASDGEKKPDSSNANQIRRHRQ